MIDKDIFIGKEYVPFLKNYRVYKEGFILNEKTGHVSYPENFKCASHLCPSFIFTVEGVGSSTSQKFDKIIATIFCDKPLDKNGNEYPSYKLIHKDGDMKNCDADNLEWVAPIKTRKGSNGRIICEYPEVTRNTTRVDHGKIKKYIYIDTWKKLWWEDTREEIKRIIGISESNFYDRLRDSKLIKNRYIITEDLSIALEYS